MRRLSSLPYMRWAKTESGEGEIHLTMSAVPALDWTELGFDPAELVLYDWTAYGDEALLEAIAAPWERGPDSVLLTSSTTHAHFCFACSGLENGDRVLYESPGYLPLVDSLSLLDVEAIRYVRRFEDGYALPQDEIVRLIEASHASTLLVTNLHNPTGTALTEEDIRFLVGLCDRYDLEIVCDEIYRSILDPDPGPLHLRHENIISVWGLNKVHGLPLIRVGWGMATPRRVERARRLLDATTVHNSCLSDQVARFAMTKLPELEARARRIRAEGWAVVRPWLDASPLEVALSDDALVAFPRVPTSLFEDGDALRAAFLEVGVGVVPGRFFEAPHHFRMGVATSPEVLRDAVGRMDEALSRRL